MDILIHHQIKIRSGIGAGALLLALLFLSGCARKSAYTITFGGDIMLARGGEPIIENWEALDLSLPAGLANAHDSINNLYAANLESPLTEDLIPLSHLPNADMNLCAGSSQLRVLQSAGFDVFTANNNHQDDCPDGGILQTTQLLGSEGFLTPHESDRTWVSELTEKDLVFIGIDTVSKQSEEESNIDMIKAQKVAGNFVIISAHWGNEYQAGPDANQEQLAQDWVDAGADLIWGHHPHVLQRMEWLTSRADGHEALILYSLGNLVSDQHMLPDVQRSALVQITVKNGRIRKVTIAPFMVNWESLLLNFELAQADQQKIMDRLQVDLQSPGSPGEPCRPGSRSAFTHLELNHAIGRIFSMRQEGSLIVCHKPSSSG